MDKTLLSDEQLIKTVRKCGERGEACGACRLAGEQGCVIKLANELADRLESRPKTGHKCYIALPCPMGSEIFMIVSKRSRMNLPYHHWIKRSELTYSNLQRVINEWGERVFLTREEAEKALFKYFKVVLEEEKVEKTEKI